MMARQVLIFVAWRAPAPAILQAASASAAVSSELVVDKFFRHLQLFDWAG